MAAGKLDPLGEREFTWRDGDRLIVFRAMALTESAEVLAENGWDRFELLTTPRALAEAPVELPERAMDTHEVPAGAVPEVSAAIIDHVKASSLVALGGGRVIDAAKAIAAVRGARVAAIPTTLSGAELTRIHRFPAGHEARRRVRPQLVVADPEPMTSLPERALRASAMNALAHGADCLYTPLANPVATLAALRGAKLLAGALEQRRAGRNRAALALGSLLCAYALDSAHFALHHVVSQSLVRTMGIAHADTNAAVLPRTMEAMRPRAPRQMSALARALGTARKRLGERIEELGGGRRRLSRLGAERSLIDAAVSAMLERPELETTPHPPGRDELIALVEAAW